jgi:hypothetical protein
MQGRRAVSGSNIAFDQRSLVRYEATNSREYSTAKK